MFIRRNRYGDPSFTPPEVDTSDIPNFYLIMMYTLKICDNNYFEAANILRQRVMQLEKLYYKRFVESWVSMHNLNATLMWLHWKLQDINERINLQMYTFEDFTRDLIQHDEDMQARDLIGHGELPLRLNNRMKKIIFYAKMIRQIHPVAHFRWNELAQTRALLLNYGKAKQVVQSAVDGFETPYEIPDFENDVNRPLWAERYREHGLMATNSYLRAKIFIDLFGRIVNY